MRCDRQKVAWKDSGEAGAGFPSALGTYRYRHSDLTLSSTFPLPELPSLPPACSNAKTDIEICLAGRAPALSDAPPPFLTLTGSSGTDWASCTKFRDAYVLRFHGLADFSVRADGARIACAQRRGARRPTLRHLLLDYVLPMTVNLRGREVLHAAAVLTPAGACAFLGPTGTGKSTLAASFHRTGYPVISDDGLLLTDTNHRIAALPTYPGLRLWRDAIRALYGNAPSTRPVTHYNAKQRSVLDDGTASFPAGPLPLAALYLLTRRNQASGRRGAARRPSIAPLPAREAVMALVESAFRLDVTDRAMMRRQFDFLSRVAAEVSVKRLVVPDRLRDVPLARAAVLNDLTLR
jgi:hypothetical protein